MVYSRSVSKIQQLEMQLEEAIQMLKLVAANKRTCMEVEEWLRLIYPEHYDDNITLDILLNASHATSTDK